MKKLFLLLLSSSFLGACADPVMSELDQMSKAPAEVNSMMQKAPLKPAAFESRPVNLAFTKSITDPAGTWHGSISGDLNAQLTTQLLEVKESGPVWHVTFDWIIQAEDPTKSFTARLKGILHTETGKVVMNGEVVEGWMLGAQVHEEGQMINAETSTFEGTITVTPSATAVNEKE